MRDLYSIEVEILGLLDDKAAITVAIGTRLIEAKEHMSKATDLLAWAKQNLGISKTQVYSYIKGAKFADTHPAIAEYPLRVVLAVAKTDDSIQAHFLELAERGEDFTETDVTSMVEGIEKEKEEQEDASSRPSAADLGATVNIPDIQGEPEAPVFEEGEESIAELKDYIESLESKIQDLSSRKASGKLPRLIQFDSGDARFVLGVSVLEASTIKKAYRMFAKKYGSDDYPEIAAILQDAKNELLKRCA